MTSDRAQREPPNFGLSTGFRNDNCQAARARAMANGIQDMSGERSGSYKYFRTQLRSTDTGRRGEDGGFVFGVGAPGRTRGYNDSQNRGGSTAPTAKGYFQSARAWFSAAARALRRRPTSAASRINRADPSIALPS